MVTVRVQHDLGRIIEEYTSSFVGQIVAQTVLGGVINPLLNPDFGFPGLNDLLPGVSSLWPGSFGLPVITTHPKLLLATTHLVSLRPICLVSASHGCPWHLILILELTNVRLRWWTGQSRWWQQPWDASSIVDPAMCEDLVNRESP